MATTGVDMATTGVDMATAGVDTDEAPARSRRVAVARVASGLRASCHSFASSHRLTRSLLSARAISNRWPRLYNTNVPRSCPPRRRAPAEGVNSPAEDVNSPTEDVNSPAEGVNSPTEDGNSPAEGVNSPAEDVDSPAERSAQRSAPTTPASHHRERSGRKLSARSVCCTEALRVYSLSPHVIGPPCGYILSPRT
eukprot:809307-Prorocentrum_minimum.AAC.1